MIAAALLVLAALAACQIALVVKLADWLSPSEISGRGAAQTVAAQGELRLA